MSDLREMLLSLAEIGQPRLSRTDSGTWYCSLAFPAPKGVKAEVASDFDHTTPEAALEKVTERLVSLRRLTLPAPDRAG